ncbi:MAG: filamentous hemagglutinin N-terminal domain-containing protein [Methylococcales bacterium]
MKQTNSKYQRLNSSLPSIGRSQSLTMKAAACPIVWLLLLIVGLSCLPVQQARAEVITDGTVGAAQNLAGPKFVIPQSLGSARGTNLFHSFRNFNIDNTESATFTGANTFKNVISRVTGGQASSINGVLNSQVGQAAFYFINPAGVVFGVNAKVNVPGDFHVSTASELRFSDGAVFSAAQPGGSVLSMATPAEFGFLGNQSSTIRVDRSNLTFTSRTSTTLSSSGLTIEGGVVAEGERVVEPDFDIVDGSFVRVERVLASGESIDAKLKNPGGVIRLTAVGGGNYTLPIEAEPNDIASGDMVINNFTIDVNENRPGRIEINAGDTVFKSSILFADNLGPDPPASNAGINIVVSSLQMEGGALSSRQLSSGNAGNITISVSNDFNILGGVIRNRAFSGDARTITIQAASFTIDAQPLGVGTGIISDGGVSSTIKITVTGPLKILNGGRITSSGSNAGDINITAGAVVIDSDDDVIDDRLVLVERQGGKGGGIFSTASGSSIGRAGNITLNTGSLSISNQGTISAASSANSRNAPAGSISLSGETAILHSGQIITSAFDQSNGGNITLNFKNLVLDNGSITANTNGSGASAGIIDINNVKALTASGNEVLLSKTPIPFDPESGNNVIQAVAPNGIQGADNITIPELNIKGDLVGLTSDLTDVNTLAQDPCSIPGQQQSVLVTGQRGGFPETTQDALAVPLNWDRLQRIMSDPGSSGEDIAPDQPGVFQDSEDKHPTLAFAVLDRDCGKRH